MVTLLRRSIDRRVRVGLHLDASATTVRGDSTRMQAALLHLGVNARDAMAGGGRLDILTRDLQLDAEACAASPFGLQPGPFIEIEVRDTGVGIDPDSLVRIFEPFYTTKEFGRGTGLGLAAVHGTVVELGGAIEVHSELGVGTRVILRLPQAASAAVTLAARIPSPIQYSPSGSLLRDRPPLILLVDDERAVRKTGGDILEALGYRVATAEDGEAGVERFTALHRELDLVLLDMMMPKLDGAGAFAVMRAIDPSVPIVMCSGYAAGETVRELESQGLAGFLGKPYRKTQLQDMVQRVLVGGG